MSNLLRREGASERLNAAAVRAQLRRILASSEFAASERMCRFLQLVVDETLEGRSGDLKEYRLGLAVFDRPESFDPGTDPIVRVEARRLRDKLAKYYDSKGRHDDLVIELPKGGYVPSFHRREAEGEELPVSPRKRLAVLPFVDLSAGPGGSCLGDGLTWELIHGLTRIESLSVVAWNSAAQLRTDGIPEIRLIREKLQVQAVLAGSIRRFGDRLRIVAQMIDTASGVYLWSETYERQADDATDIPQEISAAIIATLRIRLGSTKFKPRSSPAYNPTAYQLYLKGRGQWNRRTEAGIEEALGSFQQAVALDERFAAAYAGIADAYALLAEYGLRQPAEVIAQARAAALRALELDPSLAEAHCSLGLLIALHEWKWDEAEAHFRQALDLNPGYATTHHWFACDFLPIFGRLEEAEREVEIAIALDPLSAVIAEGKAFLSISQREYEQAEAQLRHIINAHPSFFRGYATLGRTLIQMKRYEEAIRVLERAKALGGDLAVILAAMGQAYGFSGNESRARKILTELESRRRQSRAPATSLALMCISIGEINAALGWLETAAQYREANIVLIGVHPAYDSLRDHQRFKKILTDLGLRS